MKDGGGSELMRELLGEYGLYFIGGVSGGLESFVSRVPIDTIEDLKGVKLRAPEGLVQEVFAAAGASPVNLPSSEFIPRWTSMSSTRPIIRPLRPIRRAV